MFVRDTTTPPRNFSYKIHKRFISMALSDFKAKKNRGKNTWCGIVCVLTSPYNSISWR